MPAPGVDSTTIENDFNGQGGTILGLLNLFSGSALSRFSLFALGIMPYVTASIIVQLMTVVVPKLEELQKEGEAGQAKINQYTRYLTVALAAAQVNGLRILFKRPGRPGGEHRPARADRRHADRRLHAADVDGRADHQARIGNGISLLIFASILTRAPAGVGLVQRRPDGEVVLPARRDRDRRRGRLHPGGPAPDPDPVREADGGPPHDRGRPTYMPLRVNMAGVIPVIFAAAVMAFPPTIAQYFPATQGFINGHFRRRPGRT